MSEFLEIKGLITDINTAFAEYKRTNDEIIKKLAKGESVSELEVKLSKIDTDIEKFIEAKTQIEAFMLAANAPGNAIANEKGIAEECKQFNTCLRADFQSKGKVAPQEFDVAGYKHYKSGFFKLAAGSTLENLTSEERKSMQAGSDPDGGYMLPASTTGRVISKVYEQSVMRQLCDVVTIGTGKIEGLIDNGEAAAGWVSELGTRSDTATPNVGRYEIEAMEMYAMPKISQKLLDDVAMDIESWLANKVANKFARVEGTAFWQGTGVGQPRGLATYTTTATGDDTRAWGQLEHIKTGTNGAFNSTNKADTLQDLVGAFRDQYLNNATFVMRRSVRTAIRKLKEATTDKYLWEPSLQAGQPDRLMGYPVRIDEYMPALTTGSLSLAFGDFREGYTVVDRIGIRTLRDPFTAKPYVVFYTTKRTGGGCINFEAVKFIQFAA